MFVEFCHNDIAKLSQTSEDIIDLINLWFYNDIITEREKIQEHNKDFC